MAKSAFEQDFPYPLVTANTPSFAASRGLTRPEHCVASCQVWRATNSAERPFRVPTRRLGTATTPTHVGDGPPLARGMLVPLPPGWSAPCGGVYPIQRGCLT